jgi:DNA (cytosine-5)-methyltransferase 1
MLDMPLDARPGRPLVIDLFAGGGGASLGLSWAMGREPDAAVNHDPIAVAIHEANHPETIHYCQNVWAVEPIHVTGGKPVGVLWASPDCKHFSKAKGGKPKCQNIRDLAWIVIKWAKQVRPVVIFLENVEEFTDWGPLGPDKRPIEGKKGQIFQAWKRQLQRLGYRVQHRELRACDYGAPTIRKRLFLVARRDGLPIVWPKPTHGPGRSKPWRTAAECIDWSIPCPSIFERAKPLAENTLKRIARGIERFVVQAPRPFIVGAATPFVSTYYGPKSDAEVRGQRMDSPVNTVTTENRHAVVTPFVVKGNHTGPGYECFRGQDAREPLQTITQSPGFSLAACVLKHYGGVVGCEVGAPLGTVTSVDHHSLCTAHILRQFGRSVGSAADEPVGAVMPGGGGKTHVVTSHLIKLYGTCEHGADVREPMPTVTASGNHIGEVRCGLVDKYYGTGVAHPVDEPLGTATAADRFSLAEVRLAAMRDHCAEVRALLIRFRPRPAGFVLDDWDGLCADAWAGEVVLDGCVCRIVDIGLRMFVPRELFRCQGFPDSYKIDPVVDGKPLAKKYQTKACGNSVSPVVAKELAGANCAFLDEHFAVPPLLAGMEHAAHGVTA